MDWEIASKFDVGALPEAQVGKARVYYGESEQLTRNVPALQNHFHANSFTVRNRTKLEEDLSHL